MKRVVAVLLVVIVTSAVTVAVARDRTTGSTAGAGAAARVPTASCGPIVKQRTGPADRHDLVVGPALMRGARRYSRERPSTFEPRRGRDGVAKIGVVIRRNTRLVLSIDPRDRKIAGLTYTAGGRGVERVADANAAVRFRSCFRDAPSGFPGGIVVSGPSCVRVRLAVNGQPPVTRKVELGRDACNVAD